MSVELTWTKQDNSADGNWEIYRSTDGSLGTEITGGLSVGTTSYTDTAVNDGTEYFYTLRRNTDHASTDSTQVSIQTDLTAPTDFTATQTSGSVVIDTAWSDTVTGEDSWQVEASTDGGSTWAAISPVLAPDTTSYSRDYPIADDALLRVRVTTEDGTAVSNTDSVSNTVDVPQEGFGAALIRSDSATRNLVERAGTVNQLSVRREHTKLSDYDGIAKVSDGEALLANWKSRLTEVYFYSDGELFFRGFMPTVETSTQDANTRVEGVDVCDRLRRSEARRTYENIPYHDAIQDYWDTETAFDATVQDYLPVEVDTDLSVIDASTQSELAALVDAPTLPVGAVGGEITALQSCFFAEGEDYDGERDASGFSDAQYSAGGAFGFSSASGSDDAALVWEFTPQYTIPAEHVGVQVRDAANDAAPVVWELNGSRIDTVPQVGTISLGWSDVGDGFYQFGEGYTGGDLEAGETYQLTARVDELPSTTDYIVDCVAPYDTRYSYVFDNDNGGNNGYLDGPQLFPDAVEARIAQQPHTNNVTEISVNGTFDDTTGTQALAGSNDGGTTFQTASNTGSATFDVSGTYGTTVDVRLTFGRYGSRTTASPQTGYLAQSTSDLSVDIDANDLPVINSLTVRESDFRNLQRLHENGNYRFTVEYAERNLPVESYPRGTDGTASWRVIDATLVGDEQEYANRVVVNGQAGIRGVAPDADEIAAKGETITKTVNDPQVTTKAEANALANARLSELVTNDERTGTIQVPQTNIGPGRRETTALFGASMDLERVSYTLDSDSIDGQLNFAIDPFLSEQAAQRDSELQRTQESI